MFEIRALKAENEKKSLELTNKDVCIESLKTKLEKYDYKKMKTKLKKKEEEVLKLRDELSKVKMEYADAMIKQNKRKSSK